MINKITLAIAFALSSTAALAEAQMKPSCCFKEGGPHP
jgi:hypothetical protein